MKVWFGGGDIDPTEYSEVANSSGVNKLMPDPEASGEGLQMGRFNVVGMNVSLPLVVPSLWKNIK